MSSPGRRQVTNKPYLLFLAIESPRYNGKAWPYIGDDLSQDTPYWFVPCCTAPTSDDNIDVLVGGYPGVLLGMWLYMHSSQPIYIDPSASISSTASAYAWRPFVRQGLTHIASPQLEALKWILGLSRWF